MVKWIRTTKTTCHCDIGDERLQVFYIQIHGEVGNWEACCGNYMDYDVLMADNIEDAKQEALDDLCNIVVDRVVEVATFLQNIIGAGV